jgi:hypothetical protein
MQNPVITGLDPVVQFLDQDVRANPIKLDTLRTGCPGRAGA